MVKLSDRLSAIAGAVKPCTCAADIGTDHAHIPVWLCLNGIVRHCIAGDISKGSVKKAEDNVIKYGLSDRISVRCGSGLSVLGAKERADCIIISGMGGMLMLEILKNGDITGTEQLVLQPQRDIGKVRRHLHTAGFKIENEYIVCEDNKYYNIISALRGCESAYTDTEYLLGRLNLERKEPLLRDMINIEMKKCERILPSADEKRRAEVEKLLEIYKEVLECL